MSISTSQTVNRHTGSADERLLLQSLKSVGLIDNSNELPELRNMFRAPGDVQDDALQQRLELIRAVVEGRK